MRGTLSSATPHSLSAGKRTNDTKGSETTTTEEGGCIFGDVEKGERAHPFEGAHVRREGKEERRDAVVPLPPVLPSDRRVWQSRRFSRRVRSVKRSSPVPLPSPFVRDPSANGIRQ